MEQSLSILERLQAPLERRQTPGIDRQQSGEAGERAAYFYLRRQGFTVVARRWRHALFDGEIDLVAWDGEILCFVEVKTRDATTPFAAEFHVDDEKQAALQRMATAYTGQLPWRNRQAPQVSYRFDVVSVYIGPNRSCDVRLIRDAFR